MKKILLEEKWLNDFLYINIVLKYYFDCYGKKEEW